MAGMLRVPRSRGALSGVLLVLLGAWGALIPFIGPYFHYAYTPDHAWTYNTDRLWLEILPGAAVLLGGLIALVASTRPIAVFGAWLAALGGGWYVVGRPLSTLWTTGHVVAAGQPVGGAVIRAAEDIGFFTGLGVVILFFAAMALGRFTVIGAREVAMAEEPAMAGSAEPEPAAMATTTVPPGRFSDGTVSDGTVSDSTVSDGTVSDRRVAGGPVSDDTVADGSVPVTDRGTQESQRTGRWRPFSRQPADPEPATSGEPAATSDRPAGRHSTQS